MPWVIGGRQARPAGVFDRDHRPLYDTGLALHVDLSTGVRKAARSAEVRCFKGISPDGRLLCGEGAIVPFDPARGAFGQPEALGPDLDAHHALRHGEQPCVAVTARDEVWVGDSVHSVKPPRGRAHPNHLFAWEEALFVTRGAAGDVREIAAHGSARGAWVADVVIHDGVVRPDGVWFTTVDGRLIRLDLHRQTRREVDLHRMEDREPPLGWCRGLAFDGAIAWVGFTRLRATAQRTRLAWVRGALRGRPMVSVHPTRIVGYDLETETKVGEIGLESDDLHAVFGIHVA
ncbi:MAG: hypothetical protein AAGA48_39595 [Myxococcota bacterium]